MVNALIIQHLYNKLYEQLRNYIWEIDCVECIAELEIECYKACIDLQVVDKKLKYLGKFIKDILKEDKDLKRRYDDFIQAIDNNDGASYNIKRVEEA